MSIAWNNGFVEKIEEKIVQIWEKVETTMAVLVAISIPIFTTQLEKSREAVDAANIRAAYAEVMTAALSEDKANYTKTVDIKQTGSDWKTTIDWPKEIAETAKKNVTPGGVAIITYKPAAAGTTADGTVTVTYGAKNATPAEGE